jgi:hypothetical protein
VDWLKANNFKDRGDAQFLDILELINFVDSDRNPNQNWVEFQNKLKTNSMMAESLTKAWKNS